MSCPSSLSFFGDVCSAEESLDDGADDDDGTNAEMDCVVAADDKVEFCEVKLKFAGSVRILRLSILPLGSDISRGIVVIEDDDTVLGCEIGLDFE